MICFISLYSLLYGEIIEDMEQAAVDMKSDVEFDKTDEDKESDK